MYVSGYPYIFPSEVDTFACIGNQIQLGLEFYPADTVVTLALSSIHGCDSIVTYHIQPRDTSTLCSTLRPAKEEPGVRRTASGGRAGVGSCCTIVNTVATHRSLPGSCPAALG
ncbi:MAG: hypothetical protein IPM82_25535 [Saprospiraceae bacterium]|nr:hypothetical protein [Saprospiraceae bacterium]